MTHDNKANQILMDFYKKEVFPILENNKYTVRNDDIIIKVNDPVYGERAIRAYHYNGAFVLTSWDNPSNVPSMPSISYVHECTTNNCSLKYYKDTVIKYFKDPSGFWYGDANEEWSMIEGYLKEYVIKFGAYFTTSKILKTPILDADQKAALLSYLQLDDCIQLAKERDAALKLYKEPCIDQGTKKERT